MPRARAQSTTFAAPWILAGLLGVTVGVSLGFFRPFSMLPTALEIFLMIGWAWTAMLAFCPWRRTGELREDRRLMRRFARDLERLSADAERDSLKRFLVDRDDEMGRLGRAIHDALTTTIEHRTRAGHLQRTMNDTIKRETARATAQLQRQAMTDSLTGLANRRMLDEQLARLFEEPEQQVAVLAIDIDHFKAINDALGHQTGDRCLEFLGKLLKSSFRQNETAYRCGGDEFVVLLPRADFDDAQGAAERMLRLFGQMPWNHDAPRPTLSIGIAAANTDDVDDPQLLLHRADEALYASKRAGRDRATCWRDAA